MIGPTEAALIVFIPLIVIVISLILICMVKEKKKESLTNSLIPLKWAFT